MQNIIVNSTRGKWYGKLLFAMFLLGILPNSSKLSAQAILFDFDSATDHTPLPISLTKGGITAHFSATGAGYSIQDVFAPVVPTGFTGRFLYPSSIYGSDLLIKFDQKITDFSIWYSCQELACDDAATMKVTAYLRDTLVGSNTKMTAYPGTWPVDTLACSSSTGFDSVVIHYLKKPPTCTDYGVVYLCDNMRVTAFTQTAISEPQNYIGKISITNPVSESANISFSLLQSENINIIIYDVSGRMVKNLYTGSLSEGEHQFNWNVKNDEIKGGVYFLTLKGQEFSQTSKIIVVK